MEKGEIHIVLLRTLLVDIDIEVLVILQEPLHIEEEPFALEDFLQVCDRILRLGMDDVRSAFVDPDIGDALKFEAALDSGEPLPKWINFDRMTRTFSFRPPSDYFAEISILVVASDFEGLTASTKVRVTFFNQADHQES